MRHRGFTLIEILIVASIAIVLALAIGIGGFEKTITGDSVRNVTISIRSELARAQHDTILRTSDVPWGVAFTEHSITRFMGSNYATRNQIYDTTTTFPDAVSIAAPAEVNFTHPEGAPSASASVVITDSRRTETITLSLAGAISLQ
ncbi:MAG: prepilin-type N-terminal cleavage/methylation domain-containing protein [bacterium]|nr:prepilin-type N-terminal cleavage/methylation domain-containing protein [bacterium]